MARAHGRVLSSIWEDEDFLALTQQQQRLYLFLISQPNLNHAGLLPVTLKRWARKAHGLTANELEEHLQALHNARFIVLDEDTEELLIRSFVRNDAVWKQPRVMGAMVSGALEVESPKLRLALLAEMDRLPLEELSDEPTASRAGRGGPSIRAQVEQHVEALRRVLRGPSQGGSGAPSRTPSAPPSGAPSGTPSETPSIPNSETKPERTPVTSENTSNEPPAEPLPEGDSEGDAEGLYARARRPAPPRVSPTPSPTPATEQRGDAHASKGTTPLPDDFAVTDAMRRWAQRDGYTALVDIDHATAQFVSHYRSTGTRRKSWPDAWQKWIRDDAQKAANRAPRPTTTAYQAPADHSAYLNGF
ncbi:hypothetical protein [Streptomyces sp. BBFR109]|uniref:hypothetical protein n=1 Tax=Streptomyces sp. BBFR109 TaxID=3448172 RepID=UPI003F77818F